MNARNRQDLILKVMTVHMKRMLTAKYGYFDCVHDVESAVASECSFCDVPRKICRKLPGRYCRRVWKSGSVLAEYETAARGVRETMFGHCEICGGRIEMVQLLNHPGATLCSGCCGSVVRRSVKSTLGKSARRARRGER